jgi:acetolactate synthase-1/2/3 large subunit
MQTARVVDFRDRSAYECPTDNLVPRDQQAMTVSEALLDEVQRLGARFAFGVMGGALVPFFDALQRSRLELIHCRHESGAAYAALEASIVSDTPALVFATTGPGLTNALTGAITARWEGAKVLLVSGCSNSERRGRFSLQESNIHTLTGSMYAPNGLFEYAAVLEHEADLSRVVRALQRGFASRRGFVAHVGLPLALQARPAPPIPSTRPALDIMPSSATMDEVLARLREPFAIWIGHGARHAAAQIRELVARTDAPVLATPRGKGIVDEDDPHHLGITGAFGSDPELVSRFEATGVRRLLVLGTRLGEVSSAYQDRLIPPRGLIHVDLDPDVPGSAFPQIETLAVHAEIVQFLDALLARLDVRPWRDWPMTARPQPPRLIPREVEHGRVRPQYLMQCVQDRIVERSPCVVLSESGNAFAWTTRYLRFREPHRYRQSGLWCPMGHISAGVIGTALATGERAVAIVGDGAFLMQNEISTAVQVGADVTWIVLNDARYGMVHQGLDTLGFEHPAMDFPEVDFYAYACSLGAQGARVSSERALLDALEHALSRPGPHVLDVLIDTGEAAPFGDRLRSITTQTVGARAI